MSELLIDVAKAAEDELHDASNVVASVLKTLSLSKVQFDKLHLSLSGLVKSAAYLESVLQRQKAAESQMLLIQEIDRLKSIMALWVNEYERERSKM